MGRGRKYCRLYAEVAEDERANELAESEPLAEVLRLWSLSRCDVYATLDGSPRLYKAQVCPALDVPLARVATIVDLLVDRGFYHRYEVDGEVYLWIIKFHEYQDVNWSRVGIHRRPLPDCWVGKDGEHLVSLQQVQDRSRTTPGLDDEVTPQVSDKPALSSEGSEGIREKRGIPSESSSPAGDGQALELFDSPGGEKPKRVKPPRKDKPPPDPEAHRARVEATERLWTAYGLPGKPGGPGYGDVVSRIMGLAKEHGPDAFDRWAEIIRSAPPTPALGTGLPQWFKREVEDGMKTRWQWDPVKMANDRRPARPSNPLNIRLAKPGEVEVDELGRQITRKP